MTQDQLPPYASFALDFSPQGADYQIMYNAVQATWEHVALHQVYARREKEIVIDGSVEEQYHIVLGAMAVAAFRREDKRPTAMQVPQEQERAALGSVRDWISSALEIDGADAAQVEQETLQTLQKAIALHFSESARPRRRSSGLGQ